MAEALSVSSPRGRGLVVAGYSIAAAGLVAFLTTNGSSGAPAAAGAVTEVLIVVGLLLPAAGNLRLRGSVGLAQRDARKGLALQGGGLIGLLLGVVPVVALATLQGYLVGAAIIAASAALALAGAALLGRQYAGGAGYLVLGTALIFLGVGIIAGSNIAQEYLISSVENTVYVDIGATVSACGSVVAAYAYFALFGRR